MRRILSISNLLFAGRTARRSQPTPPPPQTRSSNPFDDEFERVPHASPAQVRASMVVHSDSTR